MSCPPRTPRLPWRRGAPIAVLTLGACLLGPVPARGSDHGARVRAAAGPGTRAVEPGSPAPSRAPRLQTSPARVADEFLQAIESMVWDAMAARIHPDQLDVFRQTVDMLVEYDRTGDMPARLLGDDGAGAATSLTAEEILARVMASLMDEAPGLMSALVSRRHQVLGSVAEGEEVAHVVYRVRSINVSGAEPEVKVMTLGRAGDGWKVLRSDELDVVRTALRGLPARRPPPPPPGAEPPDTTRRGGGSPHRRVTGQASPQPSLAWSSRPCRSWSLRLRRSEP